LGGLLLVGWEKGALKKSLTWKYFLFWIVSCIGWLLWILNGVPYGTVYEAIVFGVLAFGASYFLTNSQVLSRSLSNIGKHSYFIYFFHFVVNGAFFELQPSIESSTLFKEISELSIAFPVLHFAYFWVALGISLALGSLSYKYFEGPILRRAREIK
jgi:peptidoglycan/LPS O-acetylase OafA/YrhL